MASQERKHKKLLTLICLKTQAYTDRKEPFIQTGHGEEVGVMCLFWNGGQKGQAESSSDPGLKTNILDSRSCSQIIPSLHVFTEQACFSVSQAWLRY